MSPSISVPKTSVCLALCLALLLLPAVVLAQSGGGYNLEWNTIDGGGATFSNGGTYSLGGTIGQPDAGTLSGGSYTLGGGFWYGPTAPHAAIRYAAPSAQGSGDCSSWANACTLQTALTNAVSGDEIWVKTGVHYPTTNPADRTATFMLKNGVAVYGGFAGTETSRDQRNWQTNLTILSGDIDQNDTNTDGNFIAETPAAIQGSNAYHVVTGSGTNSTAVLDGFIITAGQANGSYPNERGGGMYNNVGSPTLRNLTFSGNSAGNGGGMLNYNSSPTLTNVTFSGNSATDGGGMDNYSYSSPTLTNVTFSGNSASNRGGGMYNYNYSNPTLTNVIMWGDTAPNGPEIDNDSSAPTISYSLIQGGCPSGATCGAGMLYVDPLFVNATGGNLRLRPTSPAIDAGNNAAVPAGVTTDLDGRPRFVDIPTVPDTGNGTPPIVDMGAYEVQHYVDVALDKAASPLLVAPGQAITFTLTLSNPGDLPATGIVVTDTLPSFLGNVSFTSTLLITDTGYTPPYVWQVQNLAPGQSGVITVTGALTLPLAAGTYTNTAVITATGDLLAVNNTAVVTFTVPNVAPVFTSAPVTTATQDVPYTYTATAGDDNGDALTLTAPTLPAWLTLEDHGNGTATLSGTPTEVGEYQVVLRVTDWAGAFTEQAFTITVAEKPLHYIFLPLVLRSAP